MKAIFLYNFTRYFEWPENKKTGNFVVYIVGKNDNLITELKNLASKKKVAAQDIEVKNTSAFDPAISSQIIYLLSDVSSAIKDAVAKNKNKGTLVVAENSGSCKLGSSISFLIIESKLKFEYSKNNAVKAGLKTNDDFKALAINVD
ncbi:MAG: YfiR family protein [Bacteroidetes bacterium]|nr:YfiR family protein [Bacteroidota bacterium]